MKLKFILILLVGLTIVACDEVEDATTVDFETTLEIDIPITAEGTNALKTKSAGNADEYNFSGSEIVSLTEEDDLGDFTKNIKSVELREGAVLVFYGIIDGDEISSLDFEWGYSPAKVGEYTMQTAIELSGAVSDLDKGTISFQLDDELPALLAFLEDHPEYFYKITLRGTSNFKIDSDARVIAPLLIKASAL